MRNRLTFLLVLVATTIACSKETPASPSETVSTPAPVATTPAPAPAPEPAPAPAPPPPPPPTPVPPPSSNAAVFSTLNGRNTVTGSGAELVYATRAGGTFEGQVYDDFVIASGATIRTISWQGVRTAAPPLRFYVAILADDGNRVPRREYVDFRAVALWSFTYQMAQVTERFEVSFPCANSPQVQCGYYDYAVGLPTPFVAAAGTKYWLLIQAEIDRGQTNGFSWRKGVRDNSFSLPGPHFANTIFTWDMAFALRP